MPDWSITGENLAGLVWRAAEANAAFVCGDMAGHLPPVVHADDRAPMAPFDAPPRHPAEMARRFRVGASRQEPVQACASGDTAVLVTVERRRGEVGGLPERDRSPRHPGPPRQRAGVTVGAPACRPARERHRPGTGGRGRLRLTRRWRPVASTRAAVVVLDRGLVLAVSVHAA